MILYKKLKFKSKEFYNISPGPQAKLIRKQLKALIKNMLVKDPYSRKSPRELYFDLLLITYASSTVSEIKYNKAQVKKVSWKSKPKFPTQFTFINSTVNKKC